LILKFVRFLSKVYKRMSKIRVREIKIENYFLIFTISLVFLIIGAGLGWVFFVFFKQESVFLINKFKLVQGFLGIREYEEGMSVTYIFLVVFFGNLISTVGYFTLGYLRVLIPVSIVTGFFVVIFLLSGIIRHSMALPQGIIILSSMEMLYRMMAISLGEYIQKNKFTNKIIPTATFVVIFLLFLVAVFYELFLIYG